MLRIDWFLAGLTDYIPIAPANDEARRHNQNLPGMGGVFNTVNMHLYHYAGNNPVRYVDPDGKLEKDSEGNFITETIAMEEKYTRNGILLTRRYLNLFTEDGTPVKAWENWTSELPGYDTDCHGYTFAEGKFWIEDAQTILEHDNYEKVDIPKVNDIVVYYDGNGTPVHSAKIVNVEERKNWFTILLFGEFKIDVMGLSGTEITAYEAPIDKAPYSLPWSYYRFYHKNGEEE